MIGGPCNEYIQLSVDIMRHFGIAANFFSGLAILSSPVHTITIIKNTQASGPFLQVSEHSLLTS